MNIRIFGVTTPTGSYLMKILQKRFKKIYCYSRSGEYQYLDMNKTKGFNFNNEITEEEIWINLAPIWIFNNFFCNSYNEIDKKSMHIKAIITCSSTSIITKDYSWHLYDKKLVSQLKNSEKSLLSKCNKMNIFLSIIRPTMIYGNHKEYYDKNISKIKKICQFFPIILFPSNSGLRQPINIKQLGKIINKQVTRIKDTELKIRYEILNVGGDEIIHYDEIINLIIKKYNLKCKLIFIPYNLFLFIFSPLLLFNSRFYSEIIRINTDLAGFSKSSEILLSRKEFIFKNL